MIQLSLHVLNLISCTSSQRICSQNTAQYKKEHEPVIAKIINCIKEKQINNKHEINFTQTYSAKRRNKKGSRNMKKSHQNSTWLVLLKKTHITSRSNCKRTQASHGERNFSYWKKEWYLKSLYMHDWKYSKRIRCLQTVGVCWKISKYEKKKVY